VERWKSIVAALGVIIAAFIAAVATLGQPWMEQLSKLYIAPKIHSESGSNEQSSESRISSVPGNARKALPTGSEPQAKSAKSPIPTRLSGEVARVTNCAINAQSATVKVRIDAPMIGADLLVDGRLCEDGVAENSLIGLPKGVHTLLLRSPDRECRASVVIAQKKEYLVPISCP